MINPVWLRSFCTLVDVGHFTRTAERLNMTQSGVSQHIHKLEQQLGRPLLVREGKSFTLTSAGERLYHEGRALLLSLKNIEQRIGADPSHEGIVKIASPGSVGLKLYPYLLGLQQRHPGLVIDYRFAPNRDIEQLIAEHKVDVGLMTSASTLAEVNLRPLAEEALLLVTPLSVIEPSWENLLALGFIDHPDGAYHAGQLLSVNYPEFQHCEQFKKSGFSNQIHLILEPVCRGIGFTVLPSHAVGAFKHQEKINLHHLPRPVHETLYIGLHRNKFTPNRVSTVISATEKCLKDSDVQ
ncbi:LysR family transcriptional regulator [Simiduia curdlanivorans]|uniref:LysR family transcriptional regulator n=1 Tax=Simiduia curdlanivorans TaxID=1492769 RepID=A0ABV8V7D1_9GAMM|nr:LysR family transcriptional regulator [Simiduia curdlanivorans]MDN3640664.1 LysR family transcriptional regulator [Simiduia curdlanivorans]